MNVGKRKELVARTLKCSPKRVVFNKESLKDIKDAITRLDLKAMVHKGIIKIKPKKGNSSRIRKNPRKAGSRKGKATTRTPKKRTWMNKIRSQRELLKKLRTADYITTETFKDLYKKSKGGFFRSKRHIKLYIEEHKLVQKKDKENK